MNVNLDLLAFRFFKLFAQYEFTLKENGFFHADRSGNVIVDWDSFANKVIGKSFKDDLGDLASAAEYILDQPPNRLLKYCFERGNSQFFRVPYPLVTSEKSLVGRSMRAFFSNRGRPRGISAAC